MFSSILFVTLSVLLASVHCKEEFTRKARPLPSATFDEIQIDGMFDIFLSPLPEGPEAKSSVEIETTSKGHELITVEIEQGRILKIGTRDSLIIEGNESSRLYIKFVGPIRRYHVNGFTQTVIDGEGLVNKKAEPFIFEQGGTANLSLKIDVEELKLFIGGMGKLSFEGQVRTNATFTINGAAVVDAAQLPSKNIFLTATGATEVRVNALEALQIVIMGIGHVMYKLPEGKEPVITSYGMSRVTRFT